MKPLVPIHTAAVPMTIAVACLVRLAEILPDPLLLTTASDFKWIAASAAG